MLRFGALLRLFAMGHIGGGVGGLALGLGGLDADDGIHLAALGRLPDLLLGVSPSGRTVLDLVSAVTI
jgi:hypothetical protein